MATDLKGFLKLFIIFSFLIILQGWGKENDVCVGKVHKKVKKEDSNLETQKK